LFFAQRAARGASQNLRGLEGHYANLFSVAIADRVGVSDAIKLPDSGASSSAVELFWWYWRIRLS
jgi:hypothetical protein